MVLAHARALLEDGGISSTAAVVEGDMRFPSSILHNSDLRSHIDLSRPTAVLLVAVLHFATDADNPPAIVARFRDALPPGSYIALSHGTAQLRPDATNQGASDYQSATSSITLRTPEQIRGLFDGLTLVDPGLVPAADWRPDTHTRRSAASSIFLAGVARRD